MIQFKLDKRVFNFTTFSTSRSVLISPHLAAGTKIRLQLTNFSKHKNNVLIWLWPDYVWRELKSVDEIIAVAPDAKLMEAWLTALVTFWRWNTARRGISGRWVLRRPSCFSWCWTPNCKESYREYLKTSPSINKQRIGAGPIFSQSCAYIMEAWCWYWLRWPNM